ncbi:MAG: oxidoreductase, partial [Bacteroidales bacterium]|nr:oxidoreductase [Bacteroidales bacterium]
MLFDKIKLKNRETKNRIVMAPMCQYMAKDGFADNYHLVHYAARAIGGVGTIILEATAVEPRGRISMNDLGLWDDGFIKPLNKIVQECQRYGSLVGIQIAHAGRKSRIQNEAIVAPSPIAFNDDFPVPHELCSSEIIETAYKFGQAAKRAVQAGFDFVEVHAAHGYLISEFLSPLTNKRNDEYGKNRALFLKLVLEKVKENIPEDYPVLLRVSGEEYHPKGNTRKELAALLKQVEGLFDVLHVSSGGIYDKEHYEVYPAYQLRFAEELKLLTQKPVIAVGRLENPELAELVLTKGKTDFIALGKALLSDPNWVLH